MCITQPFTSHCVLNSTATVIEFIGVGMPLIGAVGMSDRRTDQCCTRGGDAYRQRFRHLEGITHGFDHPRDGLAHDRLHASLEFEYARTRVHRRIYRQC
jgi:hypothetical protein